MAEKAFISIGSNIEPEYNLTRALGALRTEGGVVSVSDVHQSRAIGAGRQPDFLNAAVLLRTAADPVELRARLRAIEARMGRVRSDDKNGARVIDLDLCLYGSAVFSTDGLVLPHPDLVRHSYVAVPIAQLEPQFVHPQLGESLASLASRLRRESPLLKRPDVSLPAELWPPIGTSP